MNLLDSDTLSLALRGKEPACSQVELARVAGTVKLSLAVWSEAMRGRIDELLKPAAAADLLRAQERFVRTRDYLALFPLVLFDAVAGSHFDRLRASKRTWKGGHADLIIACAALAHGATLVTRNIKDFAGIPGLKVENWAD